MIFILWTGGKYLEQLGYISIRVSNSSDATSHTEVNECAFWNSSSFPNASSETLTCRDKMVGSFVSVQRNEGKEPWFMVLCEVVVIGKRLNYGKKTMTVIERRRKYGVKAMNVIGKRLKYGMKAMNPVLTDAIIQWLQIRCCFVLFCSREYFLRANPRPVFYHTTWPINLLTQQQQTR